MLSAAVWLFAFSFPFCIFNFFAAGFSIWDNQLMRYWLAFSMCHVRRTVRYHRMPRYLIIRYMVRFKRNNLKTFNFFSCQQFKTPSFNLIFKKKTFSTLCFELVCIFDHSMLQLHTKAIDVAELLEKVKKNFNYVLVASEGPRYSITEKSFINEMAKMVIHLLT